MRDSARDEYFMGLAIDEAEKCMAHDEVPVGAVIVRGDSVIAACGNASARATQRAMPRPQPSVRRAVLSADGGSWAASFL